jgi:hypothetical protein
VTVDSNSNPMVEFFRRLGHRVVRTSSSWWYDVQPGVFLAIPYYKQITPSEKEVKELMRQEKVSALRYPTTLDSYGFASNITINTNKDYNLAHLHQKARNQVRRGLENCEVREVDFNYLSEHGMKLNEDTAKRQRRQSQFCDVDYWSRYCRAAQATDGVSAWGAFVEGQFSAFLVSMRTEANWQEWVVNHSSTELRGRYPNNALVFTAAQHFFQEEGCEGICYGLGSLEDTEYLDHFKERMGWDVKPIKQRLVFSRFVRNAFVFAQEPCLKLLNLLFPRSYRIRKTSAMIRLYRQQSSELPVP